MSNMIVYDLETSSGNKNWSQVLQIGMILVNEKLQELAREEITCKLSPTVIPDPGALMTNNISSKDLREKNLSEHGMVKLFIQTIMILKLIWIVLILMFLIQVINQCLMFG